MKKVGNIETLKIMLEEMYRSDLDIIDAMEYLQLLYNMSINKSEQDYILDAMQLVVGECEEQDWIWRS